MTDDERYAKHAAEQAARWRNTTPEQRLFWLEDAKRFAAAVAQARAAERAGKARP